MAKRDMKAIEARRLEGARLLKRKVSQAEVARRLGVTRQSVSDWAQQLARANGAVGKLRGKPLGRPKHLDATQCEGLAPDVVTGGAGRRLCDRAVDDQTRACADQARVWGGIQQHWRMGAVAQSGFYAAEAGAQSAAARRAGDRAVEAQAMAGAKKKATREGRTIVFIDESGLSEKCPVTRTWALRGQTPVIQQSFTWKQMSAIAGLSWWRFYFRFFDGAIRTAQIIEFLSALCKHISKPLLIVWDGGGPHKSRALRQWLDEQHGRIAIAFLPPYAPELNPVEAIWAYLKKHEIANLCPTHLAEVSDFARRRLRSMQRRPKLIQAFWQQAELAL